MYKTKGGLFNKAQITNEIREAKRHGPGKVKTFIQNTLGIIIQRTFRIIIIIQNLELSFRIKLELLLRTHQFLHFHTLWVQVSNQKFGPNRIVLVLFPGYWLVKRRLSCQEDVNLFFDSPMFSQFGRYVCPLLWAKGSPKSMQREKAMPANIAFVFVIVKQISNDSPKIIQRKNAMPAHHNYHYCHNCHHQHRHHNLCIMFNDHDKIITT